MSQQLSHAFLFEKCSLGCCKNTIGSLRRMKATASTQPRFVCVRLTATNTFWLLNSQGNLCSNTVWIPRPSLEHARHLLVLYKVTSFSPDQKRSACRSSAESRKPVLFLLPTLKRRKSLQKLIEPRLPVCASTCTYPSCWSERTCRFHQDTPQAHRFLLGSNVLSE